MTIDPRNFEVIDPRMVAALRTRTGPERVQATFDMMVFGRDLVIAGIRQ